MLIMCPDLKEAQRQETVMMGLHESITGKKAGFKLWDSWKGDFSKQQGAIILHDPLGKRG
jgi:hypothetical protein